MLQDSQGYNALCQINHSCLIKGFGFFFKQQRLIPFQFRLDLYETKTYQVTYKKYTFHFKWLLFLM